MIVNVIHTPAVDSSDASGLHAHGQSAKQRAFLGHALVIVDEDGLDALTIKRLSDRVGCSVGALYRHFPSKDALVSAMQVEAIRVLADAHDRAAVPLRARLEGLADEEAALATLVAFGSMVVAARELYPAAFRLQQRLLSAAPLGLDPAAAAGAVPVATSMIQRPAAQLEAASDRGWLHAGAGFPRAVTWIAALGGVLQLDRIRHPDAPLFDVEQLAHRLTLDLLAGWGADPDRLDRAAATMTPRVAHDVLATTVSADKEPTP